MLVSIHLLLQSQFAGILDQSKDSDIQRRTCTSLLTHLDIRKHSQCRNERLFSHHRETAPRMEQQNTAPVTVKKRKLPAFMAAPVRTQKSSQNDAQERDRPVKSPDMKHRVQPKAAKKQRQSQLPVQHTKRSAKSARAQDHLSQHEHKVLNTSDAALVKECKDILSRSVAGTGAQQQPSDKEKRKQNASIPTQPQVLLDIMDAETQLLEVLPRATLKYEAAHQAQFSADDSQQQNDTGFALPAEADAPAKPAGMHDSQPQPEPRGELHKGSADIKPVITADSAADCHLTDAGLVRNSIKQPYVSASTTVVQPDLLSAAPPASNKGGSSIDTLLQAMLTGELA